MVGKICYICGKTLLRQDEVNEDHVPFKGLFLRDNPSGIIKLPTHRICHSEFSIDEEYFRDLLVITSAEWKPTADKILEEKVLPSLLHARKRKFTERLVREELKPLKEIPYFTNLPPALAEQKLGIKMSVERSDRVLLKIAKGLFFNETQQLIEKLFPSIKITQIFQFPIRNYDSSFPTIGDYGEFKYAKKELPEGIDYYFIFYDVQLFKLIFRKIGGG